MSDYTDRRPRRSRREDDYDDYDDAPRRRRSYEPEQASAPVLPLIYAIGSVLFCWTGLVGLALGGLALFRATVALADLPGGRRGESARGRMNFARILGGVGMALSLVVLVIAVVLNVVGSRNNQFAQQAAQQGPPP